MQQGVEMQELTLSICFLIEMSTLLWAETKTRVGERVDDCVVGATTIKVWCWEGTGRREKNVVLLRIGAGIEI